VRTPVSVHPEDERYTVTVKVTDRRGAATPAYALRFTSLDTGVDYFPITAPGRADIRLPKGRYTLDATISTPSATGDPDVTYAPEPLLRVAGDLTLNLDARTAKPVSLGVRRQGAGLARAMIETVAQGTTGTANSYAELYSLDHVLVRPSTTSAPAGTFVFRAEAHYAKPDGSGGFNRTPYLYNVRAESAGTVPAGVARTFADADLAVVQSVQAAPVLDGRDTTRQFFAGGPLPYSLTEYYTPGSDWPGTFAQWSGTSEQATIDSEPRRFAKGATYQERWNYAVFGPAVTGPPTAFVPDTSAQRLPTQLVFAVPMFTDQGLTNVGRSAYTSASTTLYRGATKVGGSSQPGQGFFTVPDATGQYTLSTTVTRDASVSPLSSRITADWTFSSGKPAKATQPVPLLAVRYAPELDDHNRAPSGRAYSFPVAVQRNGTGLIHDKVTLTVQASYDDGKTWAAAPLTASGDRWTAAVTHPNGPGFVSLKATAKDGQGNEVTQTIIRAYALK
jgi:hypothetical protein